MRKFGVSCMVIRARCPVGTVGQQEMHFVVLASVGVPSWKGFEQLSLSNRPKICHRLVVSIPAGVAKVQCCIALGVLPSDLSSARTLGHLIAFLFWQGCLGVLRYDCYLNLFDSKL